MDQEDLTLKKNCEGFTKKKLLLFTKKNCEGFTCKQKVLSIHANLLYSLSTVHVTFEPTLYFQVIVCYYHQSLAGKSPYSHISA